MSVTDNNRNGNGRLATSVVDPAEPIVEAPSTQGLDSDREPAPKFATRADVKGVEGISKSKLVGGMIGTGDATKFFSPTPFSSLGARAAANSNSTSINNSRSSQTSIGNMNVTVPPGSDPAAYGAGIQQELQRYDNVMNANQGLL